MTPVALTALLWTAGQSADAVIPVTPAGVELRKALDAMDVEHRWLPDKGITAWKTGETDENKKAVPRTHCSIFVAAACNKLNVPILEPEPQLLLANRQQAWLEKDGVEKGWKEVPTPLDAQTLANRGVVVVATWRNPNPKKAGHVAVVRPAEVRPSDIAPRGPRITQAGGTNANDTDVKTGFKNHPGAFERNEIRYFAYKPEAMNKKIRVAVFVGGGAKKTRGAVADTVEQMPNVEVEHLSADDIRAGKLKDFNVVIHPGGSGSGQAKDLGDEGRAKEKEFIRNGGGYVGICAGSYLASRSYDWSLHVLDANVVDREHWARGTGTVELKLSKPGRDFFNAKGDAVSIYYGQGPLLAPGGDDAIPDYEPLAVYETEIYSKNGAKPGVMKGTTAAARGTFGAGRVFCFSPHPEKTPAETGAMLHQAVRWAAGQ